MCDNGRLAAVEEKVGEEARLRAMMDKDLAELNLKVDANTSVLQALATTQGEHTRMLTRLENDVHVLKTDVGVLKADVGVLKTDMREVKAGIRVIVAKLDEALGSQLIVGERSINQLPAELNLKIDANISMLQALATTQGEHTRMLTRLENRVTRVEYRVDQIDQKVDTLQQEMRVGFRVIVTKLDEALGKLRWRARALDTFVTGG